MNLVYRPDFEGSEPEADGDIGRDARSGRTTSDWLWVRVRKWIIGGQELIGHTGTILGYSGIAMHNKAKGTTIVILGNLSRIEQAQLLEAIQKVVLMSSE